MKNNAIKILGYFEVGFLELWYFRHFWTVPIRCRTAYEMTSSFVEFYIGLACSLVLLKAMKKGFYMGLLLDSMFVISSLWFFYMSSYSFLDIFGFVCLMAGIIIDIIRTFKLRCKSNGMIWFDDFKKAS